MDLEKKGYVGISSQIKALLQNLSEYHNLREEETVSLALLRLEQTDKLAQRKEYLKEKNKEYKLKGGEHENNLQK